MEHKTCNLTEIKLAETESDAMTFEGYGAVFGNVDAVGDVIAPGAFVESLTEAEKSGVWPSMLLQHGGFFGDDMTPIGVWDEIAEDGKGLRVKGRLADTPRGKEIHTLLKMEPRPAINGLSIGFRVKEFTRRTKPEEPRRTLTKVDLLEISPVTFPTNPKARITSVKSIDDLDGLADVESFLREAGMSRTEAKHLIAKIKGVDLREAEAADELASILKRNSQIFGGKNV
jgi:uncharacterized protein